MAKLGVENIEIPATAVPCASCHGHDGRGRDEGGLRSSNIRWSALTKPYGIKHQRRRRHPPYDHHTLIRAITTGIDPGGGPLNSTMPRYLLSTTDAADIAAYLVAIETVLDPGLTPSTIRVGVYWPASAANSEFEQNVNAALTAYVTEVNIEGGIFGRNLELRTPRTTRTLGPSAPPPSMFTGEDVFAIAGAFISQGDEAGLALAQRKKVPVVVAVSGPSLDSSPNRYVFHLYADLREQFHALLAFATQNAASPRGALAIVTDVAQADGMLLADSLVRAALDRGWEDAFVLDARPLLARPTEVTDHLQSRGARHVILLTGAAHGNALLRAFTTKDPGLSLYAPQAFITPAFTRAATNSNGELYTAVVALPVAGERNRGLSFSALAAKYRLSRRHQAPQLMALASIALFVEAMKRAGRDVDRERLTDTLEGVRGFDSGYTLPVTFGPNRRIGALGAYIFALDRSTTRWVQKGEWVPSR